MVAEDGGEEGSKPEKMVSYWLTNFPRDLMAGAMMGGMVHTVVAPIERTKLLLQTQETLNFSLKDLYKSILRNRNDAQHSTFMSGPSANFIAGAAAGCTTLVLIYPLDIAHTRLAADLGKTDSRQFQGIRHFLATIWARDGIRGVYKGLPASLQGMVVHRGLYFGGFDTMKEKMSKNTPSEVALWKRWIVAQAVTTSAGLLSYPLDTVRRRMMMQSGIERPMYRSTLDCWKTIYKTEGLGSFYRGALSNMFRSTGAAAILVLYDEVKKFMNWSGSS
ncbi:putative mitochondrial carrier protein [Helianthus annuus]|nr:putative mitochondrial carrier protein [Helianthus annuus]